MLDTDFEAHIQETLSAIAMLPEPQRTQLLTLVDETRERQRQNRESARRARSSLDDWRLLQKYLLFDREARQREAQGEQPPEGEPPSE